LATDSTRWASRIAACDPIEARGRVTKVVGLLLESGGPAASIGELCAISFGDVLIGYAEVVGFRESTTLLMPLGEMEGIRPGFDVTATGHPLQVPSGMGLVGRVLDGLGRPLDAKGAIPSSLPRRPVTGNAPNPMTRSRIHSPMGTGVRAVDGFLTLGRGQRLGIFAGSGVGKSVLLGMFAKNCQAEVNVICLIGERGREVREFLERDLGTEGMKRSVVVCATSDQPAIVRVKAAFAATAIAEGFRDEGRDVLLMMDSSTRLAMAQREIGLAIGEPPATRGYTPSVFSLLPRIFERAGTSDKGSITALYTVLVDGDDHEEPVADAIRSILDGHIVLSRDIASKGHFPAIDILRSISRCMPDVISRDHQLAARELIALMSLYRENEDLITLSAYQKGTNPRLDLAIRLRDALDLYLKQDRDESSSFEQAATALAMLAAQTQGGR